MTPVSREEIYLSKLAGGSVTVPTPVSRKEMYLAKACGESVTVPDPVSREEMYLYKLAGGSITLPAPVSRLELLMAAACGEVVTPYDPVSRLEWFWYQLVSPTQTITGVPPLTFTSDGTALSGWIIYGNGQQTGTPTPDNPIQPDFVGTLSGSDWTIPITCAGQTVPIYLGQTQTVRRVGKVRLGDLTWAETTVSDVVCFISTEQINRQYADGSNTLLCDRYKPGGTRYSAAAENNTIAPYNNTNSNRIVVHDSRYETAAAWITENADAYLWYILAEPQTGIVNEPLAKIGDHADELRSEDAGVTIPTVSGSNTLTIGTTLQPSSVSITGHISQ